MLTKKARKTLQHQLMLVNLAMNIAHEVRGTPTRYGDVLDKNHDLRGNPPPSASCVWRLPCGGVMRVSPEYGLEVSIRDMRLSISASEAATTGFGRMPAIESGLIARIREAETKVLTPQP